jgi:hypothetical protein
VTCKQSPTTKRPEAKSEAFGSYAETILLPAAEMSAAEATKNPGKLVRVEEEKETLSLYYYLITILNLCQRILLRSSHESARRTDNGSLWL